MDGDTEQIVIGVADYIVISLWVEIIAAAVVLVACLTLVRRAALPSLIGAGGALVGGVSTALALALLTGTWVDLDLMLSDWFWEATNAARAVGLALVCVALTIFLVRTQRRPRPMSES
ncbi:MULTISPECIES: hypothetical protein [unclassified Nocardioides]|uniref:hypothetical protein n=1 Tax=unclassified Nocardioides TaxID=2615069 RepID=UPI0030151E3B